jgi:hypothetical protein
MCILSNDWTEASDELYGMWKEGVMASFRVVTKDYSKASEENHKTPHQIGSVVSEFRTGHIPNTSHKRVLVMKRVASCKLIRLHHNMVQLRISVK